MTDVKSDPNCVEPACKSKVDLFKSFMGGKASAAGSKAQQRQQQAKSEEPAPPADCPLGREELGNATWGLVRVLDVDALTVLNDASVVLIYGACVLTLLRYRCYAFKLHSMGIYYPEKPSQEYQEKTKTFIEALALMYPCVHCAEDFQNEVKKSPPKVDSRASFSEWLCEQHNIVNKKIGKPLFPCTMEKLDERWRKGRSECWGEDADEEAIPASLGKDL